MDAFRDRVAIVTGAGSGIGRAISVALGRRGARVIVTDLDLASAEATAEMVRRAGAETSAHRVDVVDPGDVSEIVDHTVRVHRRLDLLFNNAGIAVGGEARDTTLAEWHRTIDVNLLGVVHGVHAAYPVMIRQGSGHIVNTASVAGLSPVPGLVAYAATKHAVVGLSTSLRAEAKSYGVRVSALCPGVIDTAILDRSAVKGGVNREWVTKTARRVATPAEECARVALRGIERNQAIILVTGHAKAMAWLERFAPRTTDLVSGLVAKELHRRRRG